MELDLRNFEGVAFDFDGTLALTQPAHMAAREHAFTHHGVEGITEEQKLTGHRHGNNPTTIIAGILKAAGKIPPDADPYTDELVSKIVVTKNERYVELGRHGLDAQPGALRVVKQAAAKLGKEKLAIVTTAPFADVEPFLVRHGLAHYFPPERVVTADTAIRESLVMKPAPDQYVYTAKLLGVTAAKLLVFEDTTGGVLAGHGAGSPVLVVGNTSPREIFFATDARDQPDYFVDSFLDLEIAA